MKKVALYSLLSIIMLIGLLFVACGGGGGGAASASLPDSEYTIHNPGGWSTGIGGGSGGGGSSGGTSGGSSSGGASGGSGSGGVEIQGGTSLAVTSYSYGGQTYSNSQLVDLLTAIKNDSSRPAGIFTIDFYVSGETDARKARVKKVEGGIESFEHQYKASCVLSSGTSIRWYYINDGINLADLTVSPTTGWSCTENGITYSGSYVRGISGDVTLNPVAGTAPAGFVSVTGNGSTVPNLYVCDHEVTQGEYETYCGYGSTAPSNLYGRGTNYPAYYVSWYDALVYCNLRSRAEGLQEYYTINGSTDPNSWPDKGTGSNGKICGPSSSNGAWNNVSVNASANGYRLPTEAEWEWAAKGGTHQDSYTYAGSEDIGAVAWYNQNSGDNGGTTNIKSHPVKGKQPNSLSLYDMSGNVFEWCWDSSSSNRVTRGGSWGGDASYCTVSFRGNSDPASSNDRRGFRVVRSAQ